MYFLSTFYRLLLDGCPLIAVHKVRYYKRGDGLALGPGPFVTALEFASDVKAEVIGKPQPTFFAHALEEMKCDPQSTVMIGDVSYISNTFTVNTEFSLLLSNCWLV